MYLISIGSREGGLQFVEKTGFPADLLLADPDNAVYDALDANRGLKATFFSKETGQAIKKRMDKDSAADVKQVLKGYGLIKPPKGMQQALIQGGCMIFHGRNTALLRLDASTADHIDLDMAIEVAMQGK